MKKKFLILIIILVLAIIAAYAPNHADASHAKGHIIVKIDDEGFNGTSGDFTIEVDQGQTIELTFQWAHQALGGEEHVMVLEGYKLEWDKINSSHQQATVKFIADKSGTFTFKCDLECDLHRHLQKGHLLVRSNNSGGANARTPTVLKVEPSEWTTKGQPILLTTILKDNQGAAVAKAIVHYYVDAEFAGTRGKMEIGVARTDANGVAFLDYRPTLDVAKQTILVESEASGIYAETAQTIEIQESAPPASSYNAAGIGLDDIRRAAPFALVGVVIAVWATYAFVLAQVLGIFLFRERR
ncbi:MAG: hypothetical protein HY070_06225 [Chloroflexi bacterium]|nr:hypothetical protein [Chloroflexota bacterium]